MAVILERQGRTADAAKLYTRPISTEPALAPRRAAGPGAHRRGQKARRLDPQRRGRRGRRPVRHRRLAHRRSPAPMSRSSICAWRFICAPIWRWPRSCWPTASRRCSKYRRRDRDLSRGSTRPRPITAWRRCRRRCDEARLDHNDDAIADLKALAAGRPEGQRDLDRAGRAYRDDRQIRRGGRRL